MRRTYLALVLAACSHSAAPATTSTTSATGGAGGTADPPKLTCAAVADHLIGLMSAASVAQPEQLDPFRKVLSTRCDQDLWTAQAQQCFDDAKSLDDADKCQSTLTPAQQESLKKDGEAAAEATAPKSRPAAAAPTMPDEAGQPAKNTTRGPTQKPAKPGGDPCEGGE
ncbi:MAG TPA: hypothetical protein VMJ10_05695 [Kofleriaceae bacterium]|nr:hypothetical protein [Kofleriaceae bacterium]